MPQKTSGKNSVAMPKPAMTNVCCLLLFTRFFELAKSGSSVLNINYLQPDTFSECLNSRF